jgi:hypothetical protein
MNGLIGKATTFRTLLYRLRHRDSRGKLVAIAGKAILSAIWREKPVPLPIVFLLSKFVATSNQVRGLRTHADFQIRPGCELNNAWLARVAQDQMLGNWSLNVETINHLETDITCLKPHVVLEFGSGISTLCLAHFLTEMHGKDPVIRVYSIEQDDKFAEESQRLITSHGYERYVKILHAPLATVQVEGIECYSYDLQDLGQVLAGAQPDYCLVDGPSVKDFDGRFATLPLVRKYLSRKAKFRMDDALRNRELLTAKKWQQLPYLQLHGIVMVGKGILAGCLRD